MSNPQKQSSRIHFPVLLLAVGAVFLFLYNVVLLLGSRWGFDQSWYLYAAQQLLAGVQLYGPRLSETNPPMPIWFSVIPVLLARLTHVSPTLALRLVVLVMILGSAAWSMRVLSADAGKKKPMLIVLLGCAVVLIEFTIDHGDFGQREQLLVILSVPYILAASTGFVRRLSVAEYCALGVAAGIGVCCKPQEALIFVGLEIFLALYTRSLRRALAPEFIAMVLTAVSYVVAVRVATPLYLKDSLPVLLRTYWAFGQYSALSLALRPTYFLALAAAVFVWIRARRSLRFPALSMALLVCSFAASVAFDLQHTGWPYHKFPSQSLLLLALLCLMIDLFYPVASRFILDTRLSVRTTLLATVTVVAAVVLCAFSIHRQFGDRALTDKTRKPPKTYLDDLLRQYPPQTPVYIFSTGLGNFPFVFKNNLRWSSRFGHLWMLPALVQNELGRTDSSTPFKKLPPATLNELDALLRKDVTEDLRFWQPTVIVVERCMVDHTCYGLERKNFDMIAWFLRSPEFAAEWSHYQRLEENRDFDVYTRVRQHP